MILTENIATVALLPLERMLDVVRQRCAQIFRYTDALQEEVLEEEDSEEEEEQEAANDNEFALLEKAVAKLGAIASLSAQDWRLLPFQRFPHADHAHSYDFLNSRVHIYYILWVIIYIVYR